MKDKASSVKVELQNKDLTRGGYVLHEQEYNTGHGISEIPDGICGEIRREPCQPEVQQEPVIYLLLESPLGWECSIPCLPVSAAPRPPQPAYGGGAKAIRRRNPDLGMVELWHRLRKRSYTRRPESLFRVMRKLGLFPSAEKKKDINPSLTSR